MSAIFVPKIKGEIVMDNRKFIEKCKDILEGKGLQRDTLFVVWSCKTLQNNKAIMSATTKGWKDSSN